ncbi:tryptophan dimethylallyltransferase-domain-containing protein [Leptodontidium sp. 2 PMI_412]|nr:tryptophan dimethylallyltransferase-domain-containing protein [Leptodontidium sp. 2 PMI_412]
MHISYRVDITDHLKQEGEGENELELRFSNAPAFAKSEMKRIGYKGNGTDVHFGGPERLFKLHSSTISILPTLVHIESFLNAKQSTTPSTNKVVSNLDGEEQEKSIEMMAIDCISPSKARIKMYVKENIASFANVKNIYTPGRRRSGAEIDEGLAAFEEFWVSLSGDTESTQFKPAFLFLGLEIIPGVEMPDVKLYVPAWTCPFGDQEITARLGGYFKSQDWAIGSTYDDDFQKLCGNHEGTPAKASYTYLSFAYSSAKGPYVTLYYSPNISQLGPV